MNIWLTLSLNPLNQWKFLHKNGTKWNSSPLKEIFWIIVFLSLFLSWPPCTNNNQTGLTILWYKMAFSPSCLLVNNWRKIVDIFCSSKCWMYQGFQRWPADLSQYTTQKKESKFWEKRAEPKFNTCLQSFLVFVFFAQNEILHTMGWVCHWAFFHPLLIQYLSISNGFSNFSKICIGILHVSNIVFLGISEWLSNLPNDCDHYIQAFTLTQM